MGTYTEEWKAKGFEGNPAAVRPWSAVIGGTKIVLTFWNNRRDSEDSELKFINGEDWIICTPAMGWAHTAKGRKFLAHAKEAKMAGVRAEVIFVMGRRFPPPSDVHSAYTDPTRYYVEILEADDIGNVKGKLYPR